MSGGPFDFGGYSGFAGGLDAALGASDPVLSPLLDPARLPPTAWAGPAPSAFPQPFQPQVQDAITAAANSHPNVDLDYLNQVARIESNGNPNARAGGGSTAGGLYQFTDQTAQQFRLGDKFDPYANADAAADLTLANRAVLQRRLGRDPTSGELYFAHQQGPVGAAALVSNPDGNAIDVLARSAYAKRSDPTAAASNAVLGNGGTRDMTAGQFAGRWTGQFPDGAGGNIRPGFADSGGLSAGSTAAAGGFGLRGPAASAPAVPGMASPAPQIPTQVAQPLTASPAPAGTMGGRYPMPGAYGQVQGPLDAAARRAPAASDQGPPPFDPGRFYQVLRTHGLIR